ncbi:MAG: hypothetical protein QM496_06485 [Verrucomicrobiota bacterium]
MKNILRLALVFTIIQFCLYPTFSQQVRGRFEESEFDRKSKPKREAIFTGWMPAGKAGEILIQAELEGKVLLVVERDVKGSIRMIIDLEKNNAAANVEYSTHISDEQLLRKHALRKKGGYELLFLKKNPTGGSYCAIWTKSGGYADSVAMLKNLGVTTAKIQIRASQAEISHGATAVTAESRRWTDKSGRVVVAALAEIDGNKAILIKKGGGRFPFLITDLSVGDQQFLKKLIADHKSSAKVAAVKEMKKGGFTDWMEFSKFELNFADEEGDGRYAIYVESNNKRELRAIYDKKPKGLGWYNGWLQSEDKVRSMNALYQSKGLILLSLSFERRTQRYSAIWVAKRNFEEAKGQLARINITTAKIGKEIQLSKVGKK